MKYKVAKYESGFELYKLCGLTYEYTVFKKFLFVYVPIMRISDDNKSNNFNKQYTTTIYNRYAFDIADVYNIMEESIYDWLSFFDRSRSMNYYFASDKNQIQFSYYNSKEDFKNKHAEMFV